MYVFSMNYYTVLRMVSSTKQVCVSVLGQGLRGRRSCSRDLWRGGSQRKGNEGSRMGQGDG